LPIITNESRNGGVNKPQGTLIQDEPAKPLVIRPDGGDVFIEIKASRVSPQVIDRIYDRLVLSSNGIPSKSSLLLITRYAIRHLHAGPGLYHVIVRGQDDIDKLSNALRQALTEPSIDEGHE
jgi:hypothetical protein